MSLTEKHLKEQGFKEPMVIFPLKQYETLMEYLEDMEDRLSVIERLNEPTISQEEVEENFKKKIRRQMKYSINYKRSAFEE